jgi:hypothetical protein
MFRCTVLPEPGPQPGAFRREAVQMKTEMIVLVKRDAKVVESILENLSLVETPMLDGPVRQVSPR